MKELKYIFDAFKKAQELKKNKNILIKAETEESLFKNKELKPNHSNNLETSLLAALLNFADLKSNQGQLKEKVAFEYIEEIIEEIKKETDIKLTDYELGEFYNFAFKLDIKNREKYEAENLAMFERLQVLKHQMRNMKSKEGDVEEANKTAFTLQLKNLQEQINVLEEEIQKKTKKVVS